MMTPREPPARFRAAERGVAAVELALVLPLLLAVCFAATEFGRAIYTYNTLAKSARDAARYLTSEASASTTSQATARNLVVYGNPKGTGSPLTPGLTSANMGTAVVLCDPVTCPGTNQNQGSNPSINTVSVTITGYAFKPVIDLLAFTRFYTGGTAAITAITFGDISVTMRKPS